MPLSSTSLFHYTTGGIEAIKGILEHGFRVSNNQEYHIVTIADGSRDTYGSTAPTSEQMLVMEHTGYSHFLHIPMVSFCDIPINSVNTHVKTYGTLVDEEKIGYAIGMNKKWAIPKQISPLLYLIQGSELAKSLCSEVDLTPLESLRTRSDVDPYAGSEVYKEPTPMNREDDVLLDNKGNKFPRIALYSKLVALRHVESYNMKGDKYMDEREWRFVPANAKVIHEHRYGTSANTIRNYITSAGFNARRAVEVANNEGYPNLKFEIEDINHIVVGFDNEIPEIQKHLRAEFKVKRNVSDDQLYILYSKVTSYETLQRDFFSH